MECCGGTAAIHLRYFLKVHNVNNVPGSTFADKFSTAAALHI